MTLDLTVLYHLLLQLLISFDHVLRFNQNVKKCKITVQTFLTEISNVLSCLFFNAKVSEYSLNQFITLSISSKQKKSRAIS